MTDRAGNLWIRAVDRTEYCSKCIKKGIVWDYFGNQHCPYCGYVRVKLQSPVCSQ